MSFDIFKEKEMLCMENKVNLDLKILYFLYECV